MQKVFLASLLAAVFEAVKVKEATAQLENHIKEITSSETLFTETSVGIETLVFEDNFDSLDFKKWKHEINMSGGGNWEF